MNREERRKLEKLQKKIKNVLIREERLREGQKVKLNYKKMISHPDWNKNLDENKTCYHNWVELHKDDIFTIEYDENHQDGILVCFEEDTTEPKWLFYEGDLVEVKEGLNA